MFKYIFLALLVFFTSGCRTTNPVGEQPANFVEFARQKLAELPEPTYDTLRVIIHDYSALGIKVLVQKQPDTKVPLRLLSDSALSILSADSVTMIDVVALSESLDGIKAGNIKVALDVAWGLLELNGVIRRNDLTATLTEREKGLLIALFKGIRLGTDTDNTDRILSAVGPRY